MRKIWNVLMVLVLSASIMSLSLADEADDTQDEVTQEEIQIMNYQYGAEVRLLQLEKVLTRNILIGEKIVEIILEVAGDTSELELILAEMDLVKEEVQSADPNSEDAVQQFVDLKSDAINLTKEFRDTLRNTFDEDTLETLREQMREFARDDLQSLHEQIRNMTREFNRNQLGSIYQILGVVDEGLLDQYKNGNVSIEEVKSQLRELFDNMTREERRDIFAELKEYKIRRIIYARAAFEEIYQNFHERREARWNNRLNRANDIEDPQLRGQMQQRIRGRTGGS